MVRSVVVVVAGVLCCFNLGLGMFVEIPGRVILSLAELVGFNSRKQE